MCDESFAFVYKSNRCRSVSLQQRTLVVLRISRFVPRFIAIVRGAVRNPHGPQDVELPRNIAGEHESHVGMRRIRKVRDDDV